MIPEAHKQLMEDEEYLNEVIMFAAIFAAKAVYSRYFSLEAQKCAMHSGFVKSRCMTRARIKGLAAKVKELEKQQRKCDKQKNKAKCNLSFQKLIGKAKSQRHKLSIKLIAYNYRQKEIAKKQKDKK